jgi:cell pole-organizing protein PopZ
MSDGRSPNPDPSMDDILASIRKIISDDEARAQVGPPPVHPAAANNDPALMRESETVPAFPKRDDVLLLTNLIDESSQDEPEAPPIPIHLPHIEPARAPDMTNTTPPSEPLVGASVVGATASAFDRLSQAMQNSVPPPAAAEPGPSLGTGGGKTIEELVQDMLRPMLKDWLDRNLPPIVERYVEREIVRLTRR